MRTASLVSCGSAKADEKTVVWKMYTSTQFEKNWTAASYLGEPYVMSAKHELVAGDDRIEPYDVSLHDWVDEERFHWGRAVVRQLDDCYDEVVLLGGRLYVGSVRSALQDLRPDVTVHDPFACTSGNGQQMRVADELTRARTLGVSVTEAIELATKEYREGDG